MLYLLSWARRIALNTAGKNNYLTRQQVCTPLHHVYTYTKLGQFFFCPSVACGGHRILLDLYYYINVYNILLRYTPGGHLFWRWKSNSAAIVVSSNLSRSNTSQCCYTYTFYKTTLTRK